MRYDQIPQTAQVTITHQHSGQQHTLSSIPVNLNWKYSLAYGETDTAQNGRAGGEAVPANGAVHIVNLLTCALVLYIYTDNLGAIQNVVLYHAHTGGIPASELPTVAKYNVHNVPAAQIHVVFASSQSMKPNPADGIQTAADGVIDMITVSRIPTANIRIITGTTTLFGGNGRGDVGTAPGPRFWGFGNLATLLNNVAAGALADYTAQFPHGQTNTGFMGSGHRLSNGRNRIAALNTALAAAHDDPARLLALSAFLNGAHSYKDGSLKLFVVTRLHQALHQPGAVTSATAQAKGVTLIMGIQQGSF